VGSIRAISKELIYIQMFKYYGLLPLQGFFTPKSIAGARKRNIKRVVDTVNHRAERVTDRKDFLHYILTTMESEKGMSREEMNANAFSFSIAGSESLATLLSGFTYYILSHPEVYKKLVIEVRSTFNSKEHIQLSSINNLGYLNAVLLESLRIYPPVAVTLPRVVSYGGEVIDGRFVPSGTTVGVNHFACYHDPRNFHRPDDFLPQRWLPETKDHTPFDKDNRNCLQPFSFGPRNCLGKNLAWAEMRMIITNLLFHFDMELDPGASQWLVDQKIFGFWVKPPLLVNLKRRGISSSSRPTVDSQEGS